jgi:uncharacterized protein (DUF2147 family)
VSASKRKASACPAGGAILVALALAAFDATARAAPADAIDGIWLNEDGMGAVQIGPCGPERCGTIVWLKEPRTPQGGPVADANNSNPQLRTRPVCGLRVLQGLKPQANGGFDGGRVYDPEEGKSYDVAVQRGAGENLIVTGYVGVRALGETRTWHRAPKGLDRCAPRS